MHKKREEAALAEALSDFHLEHFLKLDLELYKHTVKVHHEMREPDDLEQYMTASISHVRSAISVLDVLQHAYRTRTGNRA